MTLGVQPSLAAGNLDAGAVEFLPFSSGSPVQTDGQLAQQEDFSSQVFCLAVAFSCPQPTNIQL